MLYENEFDKIWQHIVSKQIVQFSQKLGVKHKNLKWIEFLIRYRYNEYKDEIVKNFMAPNTRRIDRHKIAACFTKAIVVTKPLYVPFNANLKLIFSEKNKQLSDILTGDGTLECINEPVSLENFYSFFNEYLAVSVALSILNSYIESDERHGRFRHKMVFPKPFPDEDEDYLLDVCIALSNTRNRHLNPVTYANVFFLWEKYSCRKKQCDNVSEAYKKVVSEKGLSPDEVNSKLHEALTQSQ